MKILFPLKELEHEPLGIEYLSGALKARGHETRACWESKLLDDVEEWRPDWVGFQVITGNQDAAVKSAGMVKDRFPDVKIVMGGPHFLFFGAATYPEVDMVIRGEAERSIVDAMETGKWTDLKLEQDLDSLPNPDREIFYDGGFPGMRNNGIRNFIAARGCPYKCFIAGTQISMYDGSTKNIEDIRPGDQVVSVNTGTGIIVSEKVTHYGRRTEDHTYSIELDDGTKFEVSSEHPFWTKEGWKEVKDLQVGEDLWKVPGPAPSCAYVVCELSANVFLGMPIPGSESVGRMPTADQQERDAESGQAVSGQWVGIKKIAFVGSRVVYPLSVSNHENFIANGFLVHNCTYCFPADTIIDTERGKRSIKDIVESSEPIKVRDQYGILQEVSQFHERPYDGMLIGIELDNGLSLEGTPNHELLGYSGKRMPLHDLNVGMYVRCSDHNRLPQITKITSRRFKGMVFNLGVKEEHSYIANGISVSNCYNSNENWLKMVGRTKLRYHSPGWMAEEVQRVFTDYGGKMASFQDDIFGVDIEWLEKFSKVFKKIKIPFFCQLRPHLIKEDRIKLLKEAGVEIISFAIESGVEETRKIVLDRNEPNSVIEAGCELLHKYKIRFRMQNLLALPVDDPLGDALETLKFNMKMRPTLSWASLLQAYPGTAIARYVVEKGLVASEDDLLPMINESFFKESSLPVKDRHRIERLHKYWSFTVRHPWVYPAVRMAIEVPAPLAMLSKVFDWTKQTINKREYWRSRNLQTEAESCNV